MPRAVAVPVRRAIYQRWQQGQSAGQIAAALGLVSRTVRQLLHRFRQGGAEALRPSYPTAGPPRPRAMARWYADALRLRREHPS
jgi:hypothetical protein